MDLPFPAGHGEGKFVSRNKKDLIDIGYFKSERLVNLAKHNYSLEPNVTFSPDMKWVVFRSNMLGATHVFAVEIAKAAAKP